MISFVWAQTESGIIGLDGVLPWNIKEEMQHFIQYTKGKAILMGRNTWESLNKKPLPNRKNIVITSTKLDLDYENTVTFSDIKMAIEPFINSEEELVVIGGKKIYESLIPFANKLVKSIIKSEYKGNVLFPNINYDEFKKISTQEYDEFIVEILERV